MFKQIGYLWNKLLLFKLLFQQQIEIFTYNFLICVDYYS